ncbi:MAG: hypothetical protein EKK48_29835 [Candidatus Melainabacteria bacterium]|nr:MAG: hypothetical protein EKK48_29835 [Candidatus Melainabacteria bacterium]
MAKYRQLERDIASGAVVPRQNRKPRRDNAASPVRVIALPRATTRNVIRVNEVDSANPTDSNEPTEPETAAAISFDDHSVFKAILQSITQRLANLTSEDAREILRKEISFQRNLLENFEQYMGL